MKSVEIKKQIMKELKEMEIIDCHEHLRPEQYRLDMKVDVFTLFTTYTHWDLLRAGMKEQDYQNLLSQDIPLDSRWNMFAPYWERIRHTSYSRSALIALKKFYGFSDINGKNYQAISEAIRKANKPGLYDNVLKKACKIRTCLTSCGSTDLGTSLLTPLMTLVWGWIVDWESLCLFEKGAVINTFDDVLAAVGKHILRVKKEGAVGLKMYAMPYGEPNRSEAAADFEEIKKGKKIIYAQYPDYKLEKPSPLYDYVTDWAVRFAGEQDLVVAVHTGYWGDFRQLDPLHMIPLLQRHPGVRFDIFHLGYPWVRETLMLGKGFSNVWLNFCWLHVISQRCAAAALDEVIDLIPTNKILGFGGDYTIPVEKVYGHLTMARENIAAVLARRIEEGRMTETQAIDTAHKWLWDNPKELYRLNV